MREGSAAAPRLPRVLLGVGLVLAALAPALLPSPDALGRSATAPARVAAGPWSPAVQLAACPTPNPVRVAFPASSPFAASGPGAIVFEPGRASPAGCSLRGSGIGVSRLGAGDAPGPVRVWAAPAGTTLAGPTVVAGAADGAVVVGGELGRSGQSRGTMAEDGPDGRLRSAGSLQGPAQPVSVTSAYLGDVAVASVAGQPSSADAAVVMRTQRHFTPALGPALVVADHQPGVTSLTVGLDYRTDAIVAWQAGGWLWARWVRAGGRLGSLQKVARVGPNPQITATISDDDRAILAWLTQPPGGGPSPAASEFIDISAFGVRFGAPRLIESFAEPPGLPVGPGALRLTRLARESVMIAWTGMDSGSYVVRAAPVSLAGIGHASTISTRGVDSQLAAFVPGSHDEALALWTSAPRASTGFDATGVSILAARGKSSGPGAASFGAPETVAARGPNADPDVAIDPATDRALAAWRVAGSRPAVRYALRSSG